MPISSIRLILLAFLAGFVALVVLDYLTETDKITPPTAEQNTKALIGGPFSLVNHHGQSVSHDDFRGKYMLIYFGYTYCPDICPMELQIMSDALDQTPEEILAEINPLFITVDPNRDTVEILAQYVPAFHEKIIGLTGNEEQIKVVNRAYRVYAAKEQSEDPDSYLISHTSYIYLMDRNGEYVTHFRSRTDPSVMSQQLQEIIRQ